MKIILKLIFNMFLFFLTISCVEEYRNSPTLNTEVLVIEGLITNQLEADTIEVNFSKGTGVNAEITPVKDCKLRIITNEGMSYELIEVTTGRYITPSNLKGKIGDFYQLKITTPNGNNYESTIEKMTSVAPILKVYDEFDTKAILNSTGKTYRPANKVYINLQDPVSETNFYFWRYRFYEKLLICKTCNSSTLLSDGITCTRPDPNSLNPPPPFYDYLCEGNCWDINYDRVVNVFSDVNTNGKFMNNVLIAKIPFYSYSDGAMVEIKQYSISSEGYRFYNLLDLQGQKTGSLTDTPPAAIVGNIRNINNPEEAIVGFFGASAVSKIRYYVDRSKNTGLTEEYLGRFPIFPSFSGAVYPAKCVESRTRTKIKPEGWPK
jgi:hypothetical protein